MWKIRMKNAVEWALLMVRHYSRRMYKNKQILAGITVILIDQEVVHWINVRNGFRMQVDFESFVYGMVCEKVAL